jgi:hypothetical protein
MAIDVTVNGLFSLVGLDDDPGPNRSGGVVLCSPRREMTGGQDGDQAESYTRRLK